MRSKGAGCVGIVGLAGPIRQHPLSSWRIPLIAQKETLDLAARRFRQFVDELDLAGVGVGRKPASHLLPQRFLQLRTSKPKHFTRIAQEADPGPPGRVQAIDHFAKLL